MAALSREFLGSRRALGEIHRAYLRGSALEVDTVDWYDVHRRRLQLDEVQRITLHRELRAGALSVSLAVGLVLLGIAALTLDESRGRSEGWLFLAILGATGVLGALVAWAFPDHVVTVTAGRAQVRIVHALRPGRARRVYALLRERVEAAQAAVAAPPPHAPGSPGT